MVGWDIIDNRCLTESPWAHVTSGGVNTTVCAWKITHRGPHSTVKLKPRVHTDSESIHMFILCDVVAQNQKKNS